MSTLNKIRKENIEKRKKLKQWSIDIRNRDKVCVICGTNKMLNAHHILPKEAKQYKFLMFDINNGITLCAKHHKFGYDISPHKNPFRFILWLQDARPAQFKYLLNKIPEI